MQRARVSGPNVARRRLALAVAAASVAGLVVLGAAAAPVAAGTPVVDRPWASGCITRTLSPGDRSDQVVCLERRLRSLGYPVAPDRHFDQGTAKVVRDMKRRGGLSGTANAGLMRSTTSSAAAVSRSRRGLVDASSPRCRRA
jgi:peptidoglycan hydrolase-like protein with peptidoglycan-binding domain